VSFGQVIIYKMLHFLKGRIPAQASSRLRSAAISGP
jgi:hypothetical protein